EILAAPDDVVATGTVVARIAVGQPAGGGPQPPRGGPQTAAGRARTANGGGNGASNATPVAARMAAANGVDVDTLEGSGPRGRVTKEDGQEAIEGNGHANAPEAQAPTKPAAPAPGTQPIRGPAATLARFMNESLSNPTATSFRTLEVDRLDERRKALK